MKRFLLLFTYSSLLVVFHAEYVTSDEQTNADNEFFIAIPKNTFVDEIISLLVTTQGSGYVHFSIDSSSFFYIGGVSNGTFSVIEMPETLELDDENDRNKGIRVRTTNAEKKIQVLLLKEGQYLSGGYLALPSRKHSGVEQYVYYISSYLWDNRVNLDPHSGAVLVGCYDNTTIQITPTQAITIPLDLQSSDNLRNTVSSGESYNVTLNTQQTFDIDSILDLTGTKIMANKPISVFGYHECADVPMGAGFCDLIVEQFPPTINWGRLFHLSSLNSRTASVRYKMIGMKSSTSASLLCTVEGQTSPEVTTQVYRLASSGETHEFIVRQNRFCSLQANKPILLVQYSPGYSIDRIGDPFMLIIPPVEQYTNNYTLRADSSFTNHMTVTVGVSHFDPERIFVDRRTIARSSWTPIYCSTSVICGYGTMFSVLAGTHYVYHSDPLSEINVLMYGFEYHSAYGYFGGMKLEWISDVCQHGDVKLVPLPGSPDVTGKVEVCLDGAWSNVCGRGWSIQDARVVCRQLGYSAHGATAYSGVSHNRVAWPYITSAVSCNGSESQLLGCLHGTHFADCGQTEAAYAHCQPAHNLSATTSMSSAVHERNPATISCTAVVTSTILEDTLVSFTWKRNDRQLQDSSDVSISFGSLNENTFQSNLTINVLEPSDNGLYSCLAMLFSEPSNQPVSTATSNIYLNVEASSSLIFQLRLTGVGHCSQWLLLFSTPAEKIAQLVSTIADTVIELCEGCTFTANHITEGAFQCFEQDSHKVTFRARLHGSSNSTLMELINSIIMWIENGASVAINGILLSVDQGCDIVLESFSESECHSRQNTTLSTDATTMVTTEAATTATSHSTTLPLHDTTMPTETPTTATALISNVTVSVASVVQERNPATLICAAVLTAPVPNDITLVISWSKDGQLVHSSDDLVITRSNVTATLIQSNLTILTLEISDSGSYSCQVVLHSTSTQSFVLPPTVTTVLLEVKASSNLLIQLRLTGVGYCSEWLLRFSTVTERMKQVTNAIVDKTVDLCEPCGLTTNHITNGAFQCFTQGAHEVTFRAHLYSTPTSTPEEIVEYITHWVTRGATLAIDGVLLTVDSHCDIVIDSFSEAECTRRQRHQTSGPPEMFQSTTADITTELATAADRGNTNLSAVVIIVGTVVVVATLVIAVILTVIIMACLCAKYHRYHSSRPSTNQSVPPSVVTPFPLPAYDNSSEDIKVSKEEATKDPPPDYSALSRPVGAEGDIQSHCWEPATTL